MSSVCGVEQLPTAGRTAAPAPRRRSTVSGVGPVSSGPKTSIVSIINARRFTRRFTSSMFFRKRTSSGLSVVSNQPQICLEPTYRTEPKRKFLTNLVRESIEKIVQNRLQERPYDPAKGQLMAKVLAEEVKKDVKSFGFERFKIVVHAVVGEKAGSSVQVASRALCDVNLDSHVTVNCQTDYMFASVTAYGFYND